MNARLILIMALSAWVFSAHAQSITRAEYFIDTDPGFGQGQEIGLSTSDEIEFVVDLTDQEPGFHMLYIRAQDSFGRWSHQQAKGFYVRPGSSAPDIVLLRYLFFDGTNYSDVYQYVLPEPSPMIDAVIPLDNSFLVPGRQYELRIVGVTANDTPSAIETISFVYQTNTPPVAIGSIADQTITDGTETIMIVDDVASLFSDADGDVLTFSTTSDPVDIVSVEVNGNSLLVTALATGETSIEVQADDGKGGVATISFDLSVEEIVTALRDEIAGIKVYPNPVSDQLTVHFPNVTEETKTVSLIDLSGRSMPYSATTQDGKMTMDLSHLKAGTYLLTISNKTYRIIKTQ
ncbi:MAG: T9SS type A sorting domain-containing protein [Cyclobacteriaceae bacterium]